MGSWPPQEKSQSKKLRPSPQVLTIFNPIGNHGTYCLLVKLLYNNENPVTFAIRERWMKNNRFYCVLLAYIVVLFTYIIFSQRTPDSPFHSIIIHTLKLTHKIITLQNTSSFKNQNLSDFSLKFLTHLITEYTL